MPNIFSYQDYRQFLGDFYEEKKLFIPIFPTRIFLRKLVLPVNLLYSM